MQTVTKTSLLLLGALGLAGCDGPAEQFEFAETYTTFDDYDALAAFADALVDEDGLRTTDDIAQPANFATAGTGTTSYTGAILTQTTSGAEPIRILVGQLQLDVAFSTDTITGYAGNFIYDNDEALNGTLIGNGGFVRESVESTPDAEDFSPHFTGMNLTGPLSGPNGEAYDANIALTGYFLANGTDSMSPVDSIAGTADVNFGGTGPEFELGIFAVTD